VRAAKNTRLMRSMRDTMYMMCQRFAACKISGLRYANSDTRVVSHDGTRMHDAQQTPIKYLDKKVEIKEGTDDFWPMAKHTN